MKNYEWFKKNSMYLNVILKCVGGCSHIYVTIFPLSRHYLIRTTDMASEFGVNL